MPRTAFILGGTGQIGRAAARRLVEAGWEVTIGARTPAEVPGARVVRADRDEGLTLPGDVDAVVDCIPMTRAHALRLLERAGHAATVVAVSSASVYADGEGRTLDEATDEESFPRFPEPIPETQPTVEPGEGTYSREKRAMELALLEQDAVPATVVRPCAIHGPHSKSHVREWYFVKRALDARPAVLLAHRGASRFHTTSAANLGELIRLACERPGRRVLNCGDPAPPSTLEIGRLVAGELGHGFEEVLVDGAPEAARNPWAVPRPLVVDMAAAERELGYRPVTSYADAVGETVRWLVAERPPLGAYMETFFDYEAEDAFLRERSG